MENQVSEFDKKVQQQKTEMWTVRLERKRWDFEAENGDSYTFILRNGQRLEISDFQIIKKDDPNKVRHMLLAEIDDELVGFLALLIYPPRQDYDKGISETNVGVLTKGLGVGSRLEQVKELLLQTFANENGSVDDILVDENQALISRELAEAEEDYKMDNDKERYRKRLSELLIDRQLWLAIFGPEGKSNYNWNLGVDVYKRFQKGKKLPELKCTVSKNTRDFDAEVKKF